MSSMKIRKATTDVDDQWLRIENRMNLDDITWEQVANRLTYTKLSKKALQARANRRNRSRDWSLLIEVLDVLGYETYIVTRDDSDTGNIISILREHFGFLQRYAALTSEDRALVKALVDRLLPKYTKF